MGSSPAPLGPIPWAGPISRRHKPWHLNKKVSEEDLQDAFPLLLGHSLPEELTFTHLSHMETWSPTYAEVLQLLHKGASLLFSVKQQHLVGERFRHAWSSNFWFTHPSEDLRLKEGEKSFSAHPSWGQMSGLRQSR
jgi:hypothetical protein